MQWPTRPGGEARLPQRESLPGCRPRSRIASRRDLGPRRLILGTNLSAQRRRFWSSPPAENRRRGIIALCMRPVSTAPASGSATGRSSSPGVPTTQILGDEGARCCDRPQPPLLGFDVRPPPIFADGPLAASFRFCPSAADRDGAKIAGSCARTACWWRRPAPAPARRRAWVRRWPG